MRQFHRFAAHALTDLSAVWVAWLVTWLVRDGNPQIVGACCTESLPSFLPQTSLALSQSICPESLSRTATQKQPTCARLGLSITTATGGSTNPRRRRAVAIIFFCRDLLTIDVAHEMACLPCRLQEGPWSKKVLGYPKSNDSASAQRRRIGPIFQPYSQRTVVARAPIQPTRSFCGSLPGPQEKQTVH